MVFFVPVYSLANSLLFDVESQLAGC